MNLSDVLAHEVAQVSDVRRAIRPHVRRLVLTDHTGTWRATAVVADTAAASVGVEAERHLLGELRSHGADAVRAVLPRPLASAAYGGRPVLLVSAPPPSAESAAVTRPRPREEAAAVLHWLRDWWEATGAGAGPSGFGCATTTALLVAGVAPETLRAVDDAQARLRRLRVPQAAEHGCLCRDHVRFSSGDLAWVEDWGVGHLSGEPLRDLTGYALSMAGPDVAGALASGELGGAIRHLLRGGLGCLHLPRRLWRDLLVLALAERVVRVNGDVRVAVSRLEGFTETSERTS